jgi:hypothetical protein
MAPWGYVALATTAWSATLRQRFVGETLFRALAADAYRWLAPLVRATMPAREAESVTLAAIERGDERERANASHLAYHLFDGDYPLSEIGRSRLAAADPLRDE